MRRRRCAMGLFTFLALLLALYASGLHRQISLEAFLASHEQIKAWTLASPALAIGGFIGLYAVSVLLSLPFAALLTLIGGALFGGFTGGLSSAVGASIGAMGLFILARTVFEGLARERLAPHLAGLSAGFARNAWNYMLFLRLMPAFPFWLVNLAPAVLGVRFVTYAWTTIIGILPGSLAYSYAGAGLAGAMESESRRLLACRASGATDCRVLLDLTQLLNRELLIALGLIGLLALLPVIYRALRPQGASI
jgi:uncharacterized membrane protein YdjX (TVP38/TMEM64 family)